MESLESILNPLAPVSIKNLCTSKNRSIAENVEQRLSALMNAADSVAVSEANQEFSSSTNYRTGMSANSFEPMAYPMSFVQPSQNETGRTNRAYSSPSIFSLDPPDKSISDQLQELISTSTGPYLGISNMKHNMSFNSQPSTEQFPIIASNFETPILSSKLTAHDGTNNSSCSPPSLINSPTFQNRIPCQPEMDADIERHLMLLAAATDNGLDQSNICSEVNYQHTPAYSL